MQVLYTLHIWMCHHAWLPVCHKWVSILVEKLAAGGVRGAKHDQKKQMITHIWHINIIYHIYNIWFCFIWISAFWFNYFLILIGNETRLYTLMIYSLRLDLVSVISSLVLKKFCLFLFFYLFHFVQGSLHYI